MILGLIAPIFLPSFPEKAKWLTTDQRVYLYQKLERDHGHHEREKVTWKTFKTVGSDWVFWLQGTVYCFNVGTANATAFFSPTIITVNHLGTLLLHVSMLTAHRVSDMTVSRHPSAPAFHSSPLLAF